MSPQDNVALPDLGGDAPAGGNLELDPDFSALERAIQGKPETQHGDPATPPDWQEAETLATALQQRTRDLRVMVHLATARLHLAGMPAFVDVLAQIRDQLETHWEQVHPQLDPEDDWDTTWRKNALAGLKDPGRVLRALRNVVVADTRDPKQARQVVWWRDIAVFQGQIAPDAGRPKLGETAIRQALAQTDQARLTALRDAVGRARVEAIAIPAAFEARAGQGKGPDLTDLQKLLHEMEQGLERFEPAAESAPPPEDAAGEPAGALPEVHVGAQVSVPRDGTNPRAITAVSRREDALYLLDLAAAYFRTNEPSSPLPLLIDRARRLATMEFLDILRDIAPDGIGQAQIIAGPMPGTDAEG